jgi:ATP-binding cassette subfamily B multidrug efflux pump
MNLPANQFLRRYIMQHKWLYAGGLVSLLLTSVTEVLTPKFAQWTIDSLSVDVHLKESSGALRDRLIWLALSFFLIGFAGFVGRLGWRQTLARSTHESGRMLRIQFWNQITIMPLQFFREGSLGELMSRFSADINQARMLFGFTLVLWLDCIFFTVFAFGSMFWISWRAGLACLVVIVAVPALVRSLARLEYLQHEKAQATLAAFSGRMAQNLSAKRIQRAGGTERFWSEVLETGAQMYARDRLRVLKTGLRIFPVTSGASLVCVAAVMIAGWSDLHAGRMGAGGMFALFAYATMLQTPLFELADLVSELQRGRASLERVLQVTVNGPVAADSSGVARLSIDPGADLALRVTALNIRSSESHITEFAGQHFAAGPINFEVARGEWLGLRGRIGCGKSMLLSTLAGIHQDASGTIESQTVTFQPQRPFVFSGTIRENLELGCATTDEDLWQALQTVELDDEVRGMHGGLDAYLQEGGINLSGGQRQRLTVARALLRESPVMLMDAPLSALDELTEQKILSNLRRRLIGCAVILVSHRPGVLEACDRIYEMGMENDVHAQPLHS